MNQAGKAADEEFLVDDHDHAGEQQFNEAHGHMISRQCFGYRPIPHHMPHGQVHQRNQQAQGGNKPLFELWGLVILQIGGGSRFLLCGSGQRSAVTGLFHCGDHGLWAGAALYAHGVGEQADCNGGDAIHRLYRLFHMGGAGGTGHACNVILFHNMLLCLLVQNLGKNPDDFIDFFTAVAMLGGFQHAVIHMLLEDQ